MATGTAIGGLGTIGGGTSTSRSSTTGSRRHRRPDTVIVTVTETGDSTMGSTEGSTRRRRMAGTAPRAPGAAAALAAV